MADVMSPSILKLTVTAREPIPALRELARFDQIRQGFYFINPNKIQADIDLGNTPLNSEDFKSTSGTVGWDYCRIWY